MASGVIRELSQADLHYELPPERMAQQPARPRDASRLLIVDRDTDVLDDRRFRDLPALLGEEDLLVVNDTRVVPAKLRGHKASGGRVEALLLERLPDGRWRGLLRSRGRLRPGLRLEFDGIPAVVEVVAEDGLCVLRFGHPGDPLDEAVIRKIGEAPLPPYIRRPEPRPEDLEAYQTIFADRPGAVAAPTASLHFTPELARRLRIARITLHVGPGTFRPIRSPRPSEHVLEPERFVVPEGTAAAIAGARDRGGRVIAVGTTVVRALEATAGAAGGGCTDLFIVPGHRFRAIDGLITNFHLPGSSLLALVMAFAGVERIQAAYAHAIGAGFRFYSYGDAMWIL